MAQNPTYNPYAPPTARVSRPAATTEGGYLLDDAERIRRELLNHEASIKAVGTLYVFGGVLIGLLAIALGIGGLAVGAGAALADAGLAPAILAPIYLVAAAVSLYLGLRLRRLDPKVRTFASIWAALGMLAIGPGTLINGYILYLFAGSKGKRVLSEEYQQVVAQTPHIKYKGISCLMLLAISLVVLVVVAILIGIFSS